MANYQNLLATIAANIYTNGNQEVTAAMVKSAMNAAVASLGAGYQFLGPATTDTDPGTPDQRVFYIAGPGEYSAFGIIVEPGEIAILKYDTQWSKDIILNVEDVDGALRFFAYGNGSEIYRNPGWMSSEGVSNYYDNSEHLVIPVEEGQEVFVAANNAIGTIPIAFLRSYTPISGNGEAYDIIGSRIMLDAQGQKVIAPTGSSFLFVGIKGNGTDFTPRVCEVDGYDVLAGAFRSVVGLSKSVASLFKSLNSDIIGFSQGYAVLSSVNNISLVGDLNTRVYSPVIKGNYTFQTAPGYVIRAVVAFSGDGFSDMEILSPGVYQTTNSETLLSGAAATSFTKDDDFEYSILTICKADPNAEITPEEGDNSLYGGVIGEVHRLSEQNTIGRAIVMGDSIQYGLASYVSGGLSGVKEVTTGRISDIVAKILNCPVDNIAARGTGYVADTRGLGNGLVRANATDFSNYDLAIIALGINDYIQGVPIGSIETAAAGTLIGNAIRIYRKILSDNPLCKIIVLSPYNSWGQVCDDPGSEYQVNVLYGDESSDYALGYPISGQTLQNVISAIREVCEAYRLQVVELSKTGAANSINLKDVFADGLHPTVEARKMLASEIAGNLKFR